MHVVNPAGKDGGGSGSGLFQCTAKTVTKSSTVLTGFSFSS
jgi:hypothetical protein